MELEAILTIINARYSDLPEEEKEILREWKNTESAAVVAKVLGPDFAPIFNTLGDPKQAAPQFMAAPRGLGGEL